MVKLNIDRTPLKQDRSIDEYGFLQGEIIEPRRIFQVDSANKILILERKFGIFTWNFKRLAIKFAVCRII